ncbi:MAG: tautomerase family protein [Candidatus Bathyarchaeia archaeon]
MPVVHVYILKGYSSDAKRKIISGITKVFVDLGIPSEAVEVLLHEVPKEDFGIGGEPASEKLKNLRLP